MGGGAQRAEQREACDSVGVAGGCRLRHAAAVAVTDEKDGLAPAERVGGENGLFREPLEAHRLGTRPATRTSAKPGQVDGRDVSHARESRQQLLEVQKGT